MRMIPQMKQSLLLNNISTSSVDQKSIWWKENVW